MPQIVANQHLGGYNYSIMKRFINSKLLVAITFFCVGFLANHFLNKFVHLDPIGSAKLADERFPVSPEDFDQSKMLDTIQRMQREAENGFNGLEQDLDDVDSLWGSAVNEHEDEKYVYYEIPLKGQDGANRKLNVEIKNGLVRITEDIKDQSGNSMSESTSERMFNLDTRRVDADSAEVLNQKDKIVIKIPKRQ